ncbi:MAG: endonuclease/exonuclease/phosphatase family protein [Candidatus Roizmanbacteria bacterium]|nr:endonuclease/exonuclease/phosphatase family protein [Candidatus Roizmanbacteria bacterium]
MQFSLLTYNTLLNDAQKGLHSLFKKYNPDLVCLQEIDTNEKNIERIEKLGYDLADYSNGFIKFGTVYGVATFIKAGVGKCVNSKSITLPRGLAEALTFILHIFKTQKKDRTVLKTEFVLDNPKHKVVVYNIHLSAHGANGIRIKQLERTLSDIKKTTDTATILVGDFNYPFGRKKLEELMQLHGFSEATNTIVFTTDGKLIYYTFIEKILMKVLQFFIGKENKLDYIFYKNCKAISTIKINASYSDHFPLLAKFEI